MSDILARICADRLASLAEAKRVVSEALLLQAASQQPPPRRFAAALKQTVAAGRYALIAEIKRASPSKGLIRAEFDPAELARTYAASGAACLSVLTEGQYFQGAPQHLVATRAAVALPVLRKDFILDPWQVIESRAIGADCILLIMAALDQRQAQELLRTAREMDLDVLIEVHNEEELERALALGEPLIGINNRNLSTLSVDLQTTLTLAPLIPAGHHVVSESGLSSPADLKRMAGVGVSTFLVGESLMREPDVGAAVARLLAQAPAEPAAAEEGLAP